jgi:hypothetical protein
MTIRPILSFLAWRMSVVVTLSLGDDTVVDDTARQADRFYELEPFKECRGVLLQLGGQLESKNKKPRRHSRCVQLARNDKDLTRWFYLDHVRLYMIHLQVDIYTSGL